MIYSLTVTNSIGESLTMELGRPWASGYAIKTIDGVGTPDMNVNTTPYGIGDGSVLGSIKAEYRLITIVLYPLAVPTVETTRQKLYRFFQIKKEILLTFNTENRIVMISGYVQKIDPNIFDNPESISIEVKCVNPYFYKMANDQTNFYGVEPMFEFPFSNESVTEPLIEFSMFTIDNRMTIDYKGEIDAGIKITIECHSPPGDIIIYNVDTLEYIQIFSERIEAASGAPIGPKDIIEINTESGEKYVRLLRNGVYYNVLGAMNRGMTWFKLKQGPNTFTYTTTDEHAAISMTFSYRDTYAAI